MCPPMHGKPHFERIFAKKKFGSKFLNHATASPMYVRCLASACGSLSATKPPLSAPPWPKLLAQPRLKCNMYRLITVEPERPRNAFLKEFTFHALYYNRIIFIPEEKVS